MTALAQALQKLNGSLNNLEAKVNGLETNLSGSQRDMFGHPEAVNENGTNIDPAVVAQRLDIAIEKVEKVLQEASA